MCHRLTVREAARLIHIGAITSEELSSFCYSLAIAGEKIWGLNAYENIVSKDELLQQAKASDARRRTNEIMSIFDGIPISVKSNLAVAEHPLTAGSKILGYGQQNTPNVGYDSDVASRLLRDSGALLVGTTSMDEFGMGSLGNTSVGPGGTVRFTKNPLPLMQRLYQNYLPVSKTSEEAIAEMVRMPHDAILEWHEGAKGIDEDSEEVFSAGGSSCGSAASVCHGSALLSLGTDTGGSVRLPAAWCGLVGLKPSYGILSRHGVVSYASSFDTVGVLARSVDCASIAFDILAQRDNMSRDSTFSFTSDRNSSKKVNLDGLRVGIPAGLAVKECPLSFQKAWSKAAQAMQDRGAIIEEVSTEEISPALVQRALAAYYVLVSAEASSNLSRYDGFRYGVPSETGRSESTLTPLEQQYSASRTKGFGSEVSRRILCGTSVLSSERFHTHYEAAAKLRALLANQLHTVLENKVDLLLIPTAISLPCRLDQDEVDKTEMFSNDIMTVPSSLAGLPTISVPVELEGNDIFKAGMSIIGSRLSEKTVMTASGILEETIASP